MTDTFPADRPQDVLAQGRFGHVIDGREEIGERTLPVLNPSTGQEIAHISLGDAGTVDKAVKSARAAFADRRWRALPAKEKEAALRRYAQLIEANRATFSHLDVVEGGVLAGYSKFLVDFVVDMVNYYAGWPTKLHGSVPQFNQNLFVRQVREPVGVVAIIMPWNGPSVSAGIVAAALATGNSVVLKPAEQTPLCATLAAKLAIEAGIPAGVFNVVHGTGAEVGEALVTHPGVDAINFTGSTATGRHIQAAAAKTLTPVTVELGGKSPHIVFADADLDAAAQTVAGAVWGHCGQVCTAGSRVLVQKSIAKEFADKVVALSRSIASGPADDPASQIGPLISQEQLDKVGRYVDIGKSEGATLLLGGQRHGTGGYFFEPTIFADVTNDMTIAREEIFGPVMAMLTFEDEAEAITIANDTDYGLAAGVWTRDLDRANRLSDRLEAGTVWINCYQFVDPSVSYGGHKQSGFGRNLGEESLDHYLHTKTVWIQTQNS
ncbi:MAG TPA: aldehyde dehydrogenase family protein [Sphingomicrobium sp.]